VTEAAQPLLDAFAAAIAQVEWSREAIAAALKDVLKAQGAKMPQLAMPVRVLTLGTAHTPSVDAVLELLGREKILARLKNR
ncbi:glutamate--tRNA ligase, partial [Thiopseudomonas sp. 4R-3cl]